MYTGQSKLQDGTGKINLNRLKQVSVEYVYIPTQDDRLAGFGAAEKNFDFVTKSSNGQIVKAQLDSSSGKLIWKVNVIDLSGINKFLGNIEKGIKNEQKKLENKIREKSEKLKEGEGKKTIEAIRKNLMKNIKIKPIEDLKHQAEAAKGQLPAIPKSERAYIKRNRDAIDAYIERLGKLKGDILLMHPKAIEKHQERIKNNLALKTPGSNIPSLKGNDYFKATKAINVNHDALDLIKIKTNLQKSKHCKLLVLIDKYRRSQDLSKGKNRNDLLLKMVAKPDKLEQVKKEVSKLSKGFKVEVKMKSNKKTIKNIKFVN